MNFNSRFIIGAILAVIGAMLLWTAQGLNGFTGLMGLISLIVGIGLLL